MGRQPKPKTIPCPECGQVMIFHRSRFHKYECTNPDCPLIEIRCLETGERKIYAATLKKGNTKGGKGEGYGT